ncbi:hypothetical protein HWD03_gp080 [Alteromonas phage vB_AmeM_PT11-V22]|uniref:Uncharacterized protein n=1 Tax=Alteromonas phage vB_AmeM_PT11-V22 TaxID=2704031 RepID=A0A6C0R0R7_9CAUD|nr:hypothetical protein HWD03_gp080 [Alteromonas phage vB_AmeM_PT11-V22]QHZ59840.1 hypothetical protein [Alteromonas phage vB_AmeM_PT11-V22]
MGQGAEDAGGYEMTYDPAYEGLTRSVPHWNDSIPVSQMSVPHLKNALRVARMHSGSSTFECDDDKWGEWVHILDKELNSRATKRKEIAETKRQNKKPVRGKKQKMKCACGFVYEARVADLKRGYGKSCSKRCASIRREFGRPAATPVEDENF